MLEGKKLSFRYKKQPPVFEDVSFSLPEGEVLSIMGPNGAGKSTLLKCINRIHRPASGGIAFDGTDVYRMSRREIGRLFGYVPQDVGGGLDVSVVEAVMLGRTPYIRIRPTQEDREIVFGAIERLGLEEYAFHSLNELSGGERQRVFLARALVQEPKVLLLDEPTSNLDMRFQQDVMERMRHMSRIQGITIITILHDLNLAIAYADQAVLLKDGTIYASDAPGKLLDKQRVMDIFHVEMDFATLNGVQYAVPHQQEELVYV